MAITKSDKRELAQLHSDYAEKYKGCKEDYFACLFLTKKHKCRVEEIARQVSFGNNDYGFDAYYLDKEARNLYLYQFKWSEDHNLFKESLDRIAKDGIERVFGSPLADSTQNELLVNLKADLGEYKDLIKRVLVHLVFKGDIEKAENSAGLQGRRENLGNKKYLVETFFGNPAIEFQVEFITDRRQPPLSSPADSFDLAFDNTANITTSNGKTMHVGFMPLMDLFRVHKALQQRFFDRNIRSGLSSDNAPNKKIRQALEDIVLKKQISPDVFPFNHNGVTLAAEQFVSNNGKFTIKVPRLLNGAQTISSLAKFMEDNGGHPALKSNVDLLESIRVLAKVVVDDPFSDFVANVTICNNRQNPVEPWNLRANDRIQCDLHDRFKENVGIFYSRQEKAFQSFATDDLEEMGYDASKDICIKPLAQTFLAVQGEISKMSKLPDVFENQKTYEDTFRDSYLNCDTRKIILAYKVHLLLRGSMQRLEERAGAQIVNAIGRSKNLVWALLIQGILNAENLPELLDAYQPVVKV